jgi:hypothetical protein
MDICLNGGAIASISNTALISQTQTWTHIGLGNIGAGTTPLNGYISRMVWWKYAINDMQMQSFTT